MKKSDPPIIVEQLFESSLVAVWEAITTAEQMRQWFFEPIQSFQPEVGFETSFHIEVENRKFTHLWKVIEAVENHKIAYQWSYQEYAGDSVVTFELTKQGDKVKLVLIAEVKEDFPDNIPEFKRESAVDGWTYFIKKSLVEFLD